MHIFRLRVNEHLHKNWWLYLLVTVCFFTGIAFGLLGAKSLKPEQFSALAEFVEEGLTGYAADTDFSDSTRQALCKNLFNLVKISMLGLTVIGLPLILAIVFTRGFVLGFTVTFLIRQKAWQGGLMALLSILPPNILSVPAYFLAAVLAINFSLYLIKGGSQRNKTLHQYFIMYLSATAGLGLIMVAAALIEGYFSSLFIKYLYGG